MHPEANHNLAILTLQLEGVDAALPSFRTALENDADRSLYWLSYGRALILARRGNQSVSILELAKIHFPHDPEIAKLLAYASAIATPEPADSATDLELVELAEHQASALAKRADLDGAIALLRARILRHPKHAGRLLIKLGDLNAEYGNLVSAIDTYRECLDLEPRCIDAHVRLGSILSENQNVTAGFAHFMLGARLAGASFDTNNPEKPHKSKHDLEQINHLSGKGLVEINEQRLPFYIGNGEKVPGSAVNAGAVRGNLVEEWQSASPRYIVIDDFLNTNALDRLRDYCLDSTIWRRVYEAGYIGATPADGFCCPLLAQIVEEVGELYREIIGPSRFKYLGAFKYDSELSTGTNTHADFSAVNVNLYITNDEANLDPDTGGMVIWNSGAADEAELRKLNSDERALERVLRSRQASFSRIPHRANRAVIFESALFHRTDDCHFAGAYVDKRINVSFLYGDWHDAAGLASVPS